MPFPDRVLAWLMRANAAVLLLAVVPIFFPTDLMAAVHGRTGLGEFPRGRLTEYLTRSASACYALHGGVVLVVSADVGRYRPLIPKLYLLHLAFASAVAGVDLFAGMPTWWAVGEGGTIAAVAAGMLAVERWARPVAVAGERPAGV